MNKFDKAWLDLHRANRELDRDYADAKDALRRIDEALDEEDAVKEEVKGVVS